MLVLTELDRDRIAEALRQDHFFWLDLDDPSADDVAEAGNLLGIHPVALEDTLEFGQRPKVDVYEQMLLLVYYTARLDDDRRPAPIEVHIHLSGGFVFTVHRTSCTALDELHAQLADEPIHDEGYLVYRLLDTLTDAYFPVIDGIEHQVDNLEGQILLRARREQLPVIYRLRQNVREIHRIASSQRDQFLPAAEAIRGLEGLAQGTREYLRDVGDH